MLRDVEKYEVLNRGVQQASVEELLRLCQKIANHRDYDWKNYCTDNKARTVLKYLPVSGSFQERSCRDSIFRDFNLVSKGTQRDLEYRLKIAANMLNDLKAGKHKKDC